MNFYRYVFNNPLKFSDPNGEGLWDGIGNITIAGICKIRKDCCKSTLKAAVACMLTEPKPKPDPTPTPDPDNNSCTVGM